MLIFLFFVGASLIATFIFVTAPLLIKGASDKDCFESWKNFGVPLFAVFTLLSIYGSSQPSELRGELEPLSSGYYASVERGRDGLDAITVKKDTKDNVSRYLLPENSVVLADSLEEGQTPRYLTKAEGLFTFMGRTYLPYKGEVRVYIENDGQIEFSKELESENERKKLLEYMKRSNSNG